MTDAGSALARLMREESSRIIASLARATGSLDLAEDAWQDACAAAASAWPRNGVPADPVPWMYVVARRRAIDRLRRRPALLDDPRALERLEASGDEEDAERLPDERLELLYGCCHPHLAPAAQVALTLRAVGGLSTGEIAAAFLVTEATMAQRLVRAHRALAEVRDAFALPTAQERPDRLDAVLRVLYLIFNEGYATTNGDGPVVRLDLCDEAIRLTRLLVVLLPDEPEVAGLCALMLFHDSRRATRTTADGVPVPLDEQDRARWDRARIAEADAQLERALVIHRPGRYVVEACIAALHAKPADVADTDYAQIAALYGVLDRDGSDPTVTLARVAAVAMADGADSALKLLDVLERSAPPDPRRRALRAELLRRAGRAGEARTAYADALAAGLGGRDRRFALARLADLERLTPGATATTPAGRRRG